MRRKRAGETASFRIGFDVIAFSCFFGVLAVVTKLLLVAQEAAGAENDVSDIAYVGYRVMIATTLLGFAVGFALPAYGRARRQWVDRVHRRSALMRLQPIVTRLVDTNPGQRAREAADLSLRPTYSMDQLYRWVIFIDDIRLEKPELLSADEIELLEDIEARIAKPGPIGAPVPTGS